jgi:hypothetical protein
MTDRRDTNSEKPVMSVKELTGSEEGQWVVSTRDSQYQFDLDQRTVTRIPGAGAAPTINDKTRLLREIVQCRVGEPGRWTMHPDSPWGAVEFYWSVSSVVARIEPILPNAPMKSNNHTAGGTESDRASMRTDHDGTDRTPRPDPAGSSVDDEP